MRIAFVGHAQISWQEKTKEAVKEQLRANAKRGTAVTCYLGGRGAFDAICARACKELKEERLEIEAAAPYASSFFWGASSYATQACIALLCRTRKSRVNRLGFFGQGKAWSGAINWLQARGARWPPSQ